MSVPAAYICVIFVWSTTPLALMWSTESFSPAMAPMLRMAIAAVLGLLLLRVLKITLPLHRKALVTYAYAVLGVFGAMFLTYIAAKSVTSGLISVIFGLTPVASGLLAQRILGDAAFSKIQWLALGLSVLGLVLVCNDDFVMQNNGFTGVILLLCAVLLFSFSAVMIKSEDAQLNPVALSVGALCLSLPFYFVAWLITDGTLPTFDISSRSFWAIIYLALCGSLLGFVAYYYVLKKLSASTVALITLLTPVFAVMLGVYLNDEQLGLPMIAGTAAVVTGLLLYQWGGVLLIRLRRIT